MYIGLRNLTFFLCIGFFTALKNKLGFLKDFYVFFSLLDLAFFKTIFLIKLD
jgi:hypothetical protein